MKMANVITSFCAVLFVVLPSPAAEPTSLGTVDIVHSSYGAYDEDGITVWGASRDGAVMYGGLYMLDKTAGTGQGEIWPNGLVGGFCIELHEPAPDSTFTYDVVVPEDAYNSFLGEMLGTEKADYLRELWGRYFDPEWGSGGPFTTQQNSDAEVFAAAVWEIIYEDLPQSPADYDVSTDGVQGFKCEGTVTDLANSWLHALDGTGPKADLRAFVYDGQQDYIVEVPEPATIVLLGLSGIFSLLTRKRKAS